MNLHRDITKADHRGRTHGSGVRFGRQRCWRRNGGSIDKGNGGADRRKRSHDDPCLELDCS
ncbi:hypothetical protein AK972_1131 [Pseudomonas yamanorum]|nr:hypothetical protein AK972_1131 [Pseudomonas yamanorum]